MLVEGRCGRGVVCCCVEMTSSVVFAGVDLLEISTSFFLGV
jgi:hypothetical protein